MKRVNTFILLTEIMLFSAKLGAQDQKSIRWIPFDQLYDSLQLCPKPVLLSFYADWCTYCTKMERTGFRDPRVISTLNGKFYAVRMDVESRDTVRFGTEVYVNAEAGRKRRAFHEIARLLALPEDGRRRLPATLLLDEGLRLRRRSFEYLDPVELLSFLDPD